MGTTGITPLNTAPAGPTFLDRVKFLQEHIKIVLGLATGSLVLSVSLIQKVEQSKRKDWLHDAWLWLFVAILAGVACNYLLTLHLNSSKDWYRKLVAVVSAVLHGAFIAAMIYFLRFAFVNM